MVSKMPAEGRQAKPALPRLTAEQWKAANGSAAVRLQRATTARVYYNWRSPEEASLLRLRWKR